MVTAPPRVRAGRGAGSVTCHPRPIRTGGRICRKLRGVDFDEMLRLEPHGPDTYVGRGPRYPWGGLYGGQIVAQGLRAAADTVDPQFRAHSLHAYFIRRGD